MADVLWTQKQDVGPSGRAGHAMAYDAARRRVLLFGGRTASAGQSYADTWEWDGSYWTQVADTGPDARAGHAMVFDSGRKTVLLFGGVDGTANSLRADTWEWNGAAWTQLADTGPDARLGHGLAFDSARGRAVLFGGNGVAALGDTWEWDGDEWTQVADTGPGARTGHAFSFDPRRKRAVLFGGSDYGLHHYDDTWEWDGDEWTQVADNGPAHLQLAAMVFDGLTTLLFGGLGLANGGLQPSRLSWEWDGAHWTVRQDMGPAPRWWHSLAYDTARERAVLFGGLFDDPSSPDSPDGTFGDTWEAVLRHPPVLIAFRLSPHTTQAAATAIPLTFDVELAGPAPSGGLTVEVFTAAGSQMTIPIADSAKTGSAKTTLQGPQPPHSETYTAHLGEITLTERLDLL